MNKTLTRNDLIEAISDKVGISLNDSSEMIENIFDFILTELENGHDVKISSFGTFKVKQKNLRMGRNPKTGIDVPIKPRKVVSFYSSNVLKSKFK
jgi:integration host factor subunit alpha